MRFFLLSMMVWTVVGMTIAPLWAQHLPFQLERYGIEDGISHRKVYGVVQDREGFLWIATEDGLNRFDGYEYKVFGNKLDTSRQFTSNIIFHLTIDTKGILWLGTNKGVTLFNPHTFESSNLIVSDYPLATYDLRYKSYVDNIGNVWVLRPNKVGLEAWEYRNYKPTGLVIHPKQQSSDRLPNLVNIASDTTGNTWIMFSSTLFWVTPDNHVKEYPTIQTSKKEKNYWLSIGLDEKGPLLSHSDKKLFRFNPLKEQLEELPISGRGIVRVSDQHFSFFVNDKEWWFLGSPDFLALYNPITEEVQNISRPFFDILGTGLIGQLYKDSNDNVWICSVNGLFKTQRKPQLFHSFLKSDKKNYLNSSRKILEAADGKILIGTYDGLYQFDKTGGGAQRLIAKDPTNFVPYFLIRDPTQSKIIWAGGEGYSKLHRIDLTTHTKKDIGYSIGKSFELAVENDTTLWASTSQGLELFNTRSETFTPYQDATGRYDFSKIFTNDIYKSKKGETWLGTAVGLFKIDLLKGVQAYFPLTKPGQSVIPVLFIYEQSDSVFWLGTNGAGLLRLNHLTGAYRQYLEKDGLPNNVVYAILNSGDYLWMSTDNGLSRLYLPAMRFDNFTETDGLAHHEFNNKSFLKASDGTFYFGGINGVTYFNPKEIQLQASVSRVFLTRYLREDGNSGALVVQDTALGQLKTIRLGFKDRYFILDIALNNLTAPQKNTFAYMLEGYENQWNYVGTQRSLRFNGLPAGTYTLRIKGTDGQGLWSEERRIEVVVDAAFYKTWWFFTLCGLAIFGISYGIFRYRIARIREMEQMRTRIASDLHDEVGSILTRIAMQAQLAERKADDKDKSFLHQVAENSRVAISTMRDVIWTIDSRNDTVGELLERMEDLAHAMLGAAGKAYQFQVEALRRDSEMDVKIRQNLYLIYKEAVNNIVKHSNAKKVLIELKNEAGYFYMKIADDGTAKDASSRETGKGQGLRNMEMRAGRIQAMLTIHQDNGFEIRLKRRVFV